MEKTLKERNALPVAVLLAGYGAWAAFAAAMAFAREVAPISDLMAALLGAFFADGKVPAVAERFVDFILGLVAAVMMAWAALCAFVASGPLRAGRRRARVALAVSACAWFAVDEAFSVAFGVWINVAGNLALFLWFLLPLAFVETAKDA